MARQFCFEINWPLEETINCFQDLLTFSFGTSGISLSVPVNSLILLKPVMKQQLSKPDITFFFRLRLHVVQSENRNLIHHSSRLPWNVEPILAPHMLNHVTQSTYATVSFLCVYCTYVYAMPIGLYVN